jgi:hypothetical protein
MTQVFKSPAFIVLMVMGLFNALPALWSGGELFGTPTLPVTSSLIPILEGSFSFVPLLVAIYYAGELVWRERDRKMHEIVDATPLPNWAYVVPKTAAVALVLLSILAVSAIAAMLVQLVKGHTNLEIGKYLAWYVLPNGVDFLLLAVLAVFVQAVSPNKYVGWGIMVLYVVLQIIAGNVGLEHNLYVYGGVPRVQYSDMNGAGSFWIGAWAFRAYWVAVALILLVAAHLLWRRGTETRLKPRLARAPARLRGTPGVLAGASLLAVLGLGGWIFYNTNVLNEYRTSDEGEKFIADYERKFLPYEKLPQPTVSDVKLDVALYPEELRAVTKGRYLLTNLTQQPIQDVHVRNTNRDLELVRLDFPGARLASEDKKFGYRIYRLGQPMQPGERRELSSRRCAGHAASATRAATPAWSRTAPSSTISNLRRRSGWTAPSSSGSQRAPPQRPSRRAPTGQARRRFGDAKELFRRRLVDRGHYRFDQRGPAADRARQEGLGRHARRAPDRPLRLRRADPHLLLDPVRPLRGAQAQPQGRGTRRLLRPAAPVQCRHHAECDAGVARLFRPELRALPVRSGADHRVSGLCELRPGVREHHALFGSDRLHRRHVRQGGDRLRHLHHGA